MQRNQLLLMIRKSGLKVDYSIKQVIIQISEDIDRMILDDLIKLGARRE
jgi:hypothetical protein